MPTSVRAGRLDSMALGTELPARDPALSNRRALAAGALTLVLVLLAAWWTRGSSCHLEPRHEEAVRHAAAELGIGGPVSLRCLGPDSVFADFPLRDEVGGEGSALRPETERRLEVLRTALAPFGFKRFRVLVTAGGEGRRARQAEASQEIGGPVEWHEH